MKHIGQKIEWIRKKNGYSRQFVAENICDESTLYRIEKSTQLPRLDVLQNICQKLNVSVDFVLTPEEDSSAIYVSKIKKLCRESLYQQDFNSLQYVIEEAENYIRKNSHQLDKSFIRFIEWQKAILSHKKERFPKKAEKSLRKLLNHKVITELDINISNSLAIILIETKEYDEAAVFLSKGLTALETLLSVEDKSLYPRVAYNMAYIHYLKKQYDACIDLAYRLQYYLLSNHLFYSKGELYHLLGIVYEVQKDYENAYKYFTDAISVFSLEGKELFLLRTMRALAEVCYLKGDRAEGDKLVADSIRRIERIEDKELAETFLKKIKHTEEQYAKR